MFAEKQNNCLQDSKETIANNSTNLVIKSIQNYNQNGSEINNTIDLDSRNKIQSLLLLQKAEILRLTQCLNDCKCKLRQYNAENLDRKSYEIQIAQLFQSNNKNRSQIQKLNNSIKSLVSSNENYRKQLGFSNQKVFELEHNKRQIHEKYQILNFEYDIMSKDYQTYRKQNEQNQQRLQKQIMFQKNYVDNLKANSEDLMKRINTIPTYENQIFELEKRISFYKNENEGLNQQLVRNRQKLSNVEKNHLELYQKNDKTEQKYEEMKKINSELQNTLKNCINQTIKEEQGLKIEKLPNNINKEVKKIMHLQQQIKTLNLRNQKTTTTSKALTDISNKLREEKKCLEAQIHSLKRIVQDYQKKINDQLNKNSLLSHELNKQVSQIRKQLVQKQQQASSLVQQNEKLKQQIQGFNKMITSKIKQSQYLKRKLIQVQSDLRQQFESNFLEQKKLHNQQLAEMEKKLCMNHQQNNSEKNSKQYSFIKQLGDDKNQIMIQSQNAHKQDNNSQAQIKSLKLELQNRQSQIDNLAIQRNQFSVLLQNKTSQNQKLKMKLLDLEENYRDVLTQAVQKIKLSYETKIAQLQQKFIKQKIHLKDVATAQNINDIKQLTIQRDRLYKQVNQLKTELKQSDTKFIETWKQIEKLHQLLETNQLKYKTKIELYFRNNLILQQNLNKTNKSLAHKQVKFQQCIHLLKQLQETNSENIKNLSKLQTQFISIQLLTSELKQQRDLLLKKNSTLIKGIQHLNHQIRIIHEGAQKIAMFFTKDSTIHETLQKHYSTVHQIFNSIQKLREEDQKAHNLQTHSNI